jgi:hypothetical protein
VQRNHKVISFEPITRFVADRAGGIVGNGLHLLQEEETGGFGGGMAITHAMKGALLGSDLDVMNENMIKNLETSLNELEFRKGSFDLNAWLRHAITIASTDSVYGPFNPYRNEAIETAFW